MDFNLLIKSVINQLFNIIYKRKCINCACAIREGILCKTCLKPVQNLPLFAHSIIEGKKVFSAFYYTGAVKSLIKELKFRHNKACAYYAAKFLYDYLIKLKENGVEFENPIIVPIPTHKKHINKRGYNNVYEIAVELAKLTNYKINSKFLIKKEFRKSQYELTGKQRRENPFGSFELLDGFSPDDFIILLDDVVTTGATLNSAISLFKSKNIQKLVCLTLAKAK